MRRITIACLLLLCALPIAAPVPAAANHGDRRPNILVIVTDDQRLQGSMETLRFTTDWFGNGGTRYSQAFATTPLCCPARASIMTGLYAHNHGVIDNYKVKGLDHSLTIQHHLLGAGYTTAVVGKFFNVWPLQEKPPYFERYAICSPCGYSSRPFGVDGVITDPVNYSTTYMRRKAVSFLKDFEDDDDKPWYLYIAPFAPHAPAIPSSFYERRPVSRWSPSPAAREVDLTDKPAFVANNAVSLNYARRLRRDQLRALYSVDSLVKNVVERLERLDEDEETLAIFVSDNGLMWHDHGLVGKRFPYTESIQVPLMIRWPGHVETGQTDDSIVANIDIAPTIMEAAEIELPSKPMDGKSLLSSSPRQMLFLEHWSDPHRGYNDWASIRTDDYQYVEYYSSGDRTAPVFREYYDLAEDPWQLQNLIAEAITPEPQSLALSALVQVLARCRSATCP